MSEDLIDMEGGLRPPLHPSKKSLLVKNFRYTSLHCDGHRRFCCGCRFKIMIGVAL